MASQPARLRRDAGVSDRRVGRDDRRAAHVPRRRGAPRRGSAGGTRARCGTRTRARDRRHESRREQALHVRQPRAGPEVVRRDPAAARCGHVPARRGVSGPPVEGDGCRRARRRAERVAARAGLRLSLRLGRGADDSRRGSLADARRGPRLRDPVRLRTLRSRSRGQPDLHGRRTRRGGRPCRRR